MGVFGAAGILEVDLHDASPAVAAPPPPHRTVVVVSKWVCVVCSGALSLVYRWCVWWWSLWLWLPCLWDREIDVTLASWSVVVLASCVVVLLVCGCVVGMVGRVVVVVWWLVWWSVYVYRVEVSLSLRWLLVWRCPWWRV